jgi:hypothetical protein
MFITVHTEARYYVISWAIRIQFTVSNFIFEYKIQYYPPNYAYFSYELYSLKL